VILFSLHKFVFQNKGKKLLVCNERGRKEMGAKCGERDRERERGKRG
jgi:hypothetical protein